MSLLTTAEVAAVIAKAERDYKRYSRTLLIATLIATLGLVVYMIMAAADFHGVALVGRMVCVIGCMVGARAYLGTLAKRIRILECLVFLQGRP